VLFTRWAGTEFRMDGEEYMIMREDDLLGVIES
jgi:chaperonin GroES